MVNRDTFSSYHPLVNFLYFALVLVFGMRFMHSVCLVISLGSATAYNLYLKGREGLLFSLRFLSPMMILVAILNPAFKHEGVTILAYTPKTTLSPWRALYMVWPPLRCRRAWCSGSHATMRS